MNLPSNLVDQFHPTLNGDKSIIDATSNVNRKVWWLGACGHEWERSTRIALGSNLCPYCTGRRFLAGLNDFGTIYPELAKEWHPTKNGSHTPSDFSSKSGDKVWWLGSCGHEWEAVIHSRADGNKCPYCSNKKALSGYNDLATINPELASEWHPTKNSNISPSEVLPRSGKTYWWLGACGHEWEAAPDTRFSSGCPACAGKRVARGFNDLQFINPDLASEWHPTKNGNKHPDDFTSGSRKQVWWGCSKGHEWQASISDRKRGTNCPHCSGRLLIGFNDLATINPSLSKEWHPTKNGNLTASQVSKGSHDRTWWLCTKGHEWQAVIQDRVNGNGCPICANKKVYTGFNDLATTHPHLASEWHPTLNDDRTPENVTSKGKAWWVGVCGHEWEQRILKRKAGQGCPQCLNLVSKAEKEISAVFIEAGIETVISDKTILAGKELDIYLPDNKIAIEFNGLFWHSEDNGRDSKYHYDKWKSCADKGIQLIQIWEDDWIRDKELVLNSLKTKVGISSLEKVYARKSQVVEVTNKVAEEFLSKNHIQGFASGSYYLGLQDKASSKLLAVLVLRKEPGSDGKVLNIIRYATSVQVVGGFTKLIKHAEITFKPESFITFSDHAISDGKLYENNGFKADRELAPDYMYLKNKKRYHKFGYRLKRFKNDPDLLWEEGLTEKQLAQLNNLPRIWDAGKTRWVKEVGK